MYKKYTLFGQQSSQALQLAGVHAGPVLPQLLQLLQHCVAFAVQHTLQVTHGRLGVGLQLLLQGLQALHALLHSQLPCLQAKEDIDTCQEAKELRHKVL